MRPGMTALGIGAGVAVLVMGASVVGPPSEVGEEHPPELEPVISTSVVCPYAGGEGDTSRIGVLALSEVDEATTEGGEPAPITVTPLETREPDSEDDSAGESSDKAPEPLFTVAGRGKPSIKGVDTQKPTSFVVNADGPLAAGLVAETAMYLAEFDIHGYSSAPCSNAERDHWFMGGSGQEGRRGKLVLSNPANVPAVVDVDLWTGDGPLVTPATQDLSVPPNSQRLVLLDALAPDARQVAVHVSAQRGRVSAAIEVRESESGTPRGISFLPVAAAPAHELVIPGIAQKTSAYLHVLAPGEVDAIVHVKYLGSSGSFKPSGQDVLTVPAGQVLSVPLEGIDEPMAVALESDEPVTAGVRLSRSSGDGPRDLAFSAASKPLDGPTAVLLGRTKNEFSTSLVISSVADATSRVTIQRIDNDGKVVGEETVDVPAGATVPVRLRTVDGASYPYAVVRPADRDALMVARVVTAVNADGAFIDVLPLTSAPTKVDVPEVVAELPEIPDPNATEPPG